MVGHHDGGGTGLPGLQSTLDGHHTLDDEGPLGQLHDLGQLFHALAAGRRGHVLEEGQACCIHVHSHGKAAAGLGLRHLFLDGVDVPGLDGGHTAAACRADGLGGHFHHGGVGAVTGKGGNAVLGAGAYQHVVIGHIGVGLGVVQVHRTHRACKEGVFELLAKQFKRGIRGAALTQGVHVHTDLGPLIIIADGGIAHALGTGARDLVFAGHAVAHRAGLAVFANALTGIGQHFRISHKKASSFFYSTLRPQRFPAAVLSCFIIVRFNRFVKGFCRIPEFFAVFCLHRDVVLKKNIFFKKSLTKAVLSGIIVWRCGAQPNMERWLSWSKAHDWKSCNVSKAFWGSNPHLSARNPEPLGPGFFVLSSHFSF